MGSSMVKTFTSQHSLTMLQPATDWSIETLKSEYQQVFSSFERNLLFYSPLVRFLGNNALQPPENEKGNLSAHGDRHSMTFLTFLDALSGIKTN